MLVTGAYTCNGAIGVIPMPTLPPVTTMLLVFKELALMDPDTPALPALIEVLFKEDELIVVEAMVVATSEGAVIPAFTNIFPVVKVVKVPLIAFTLPVLTLVEASTVPVVMPVLTTAFNTFKVPVLRAVATTFVPVMFTPLI